MAIEYTVLLNEALTHPGKQLEAYRAFHNYSVGNQMLAIMHLEKAEPINTYKGWQELGRQVKKGSKAIALWMPISCKAERTNEAGEVESVNYSRFLFKNNWFPLSMTEGADYIAPEFSSNWDKEKALAALNITETEFSHCNGNIQGYATRARQIAISPLAALPHKTTFHEIAHIALGHTDSEDMNDNVELARNIMEVEAEAVAYILCSLLALPGVEYSRAYIQKWLGSSQVTEKNAQRIYTAANKILKAGA